VVIAPGSTQEIFLNFPVEIGVFIVKGTMPEILDIFSFCRPKFSLYGSPGTGEICRWAESRVHDQFPLADRLRQGVMALRIKNNCQAWVEISRAVFEADGMKLFYGDAVSMWAEITILSSVVAETVFPDSLPRAGMRPSLEIYKSKVIPGIDIYTTKKLPGVDAKGYLMEWGLK
jgi:hypothetical protein